MAVKRMDNVGIVVEDLDAAIEFFTELGLGLCPHPSSPRLLESTTPIRQ